MVVLSPVPLEQIKLDGGRQIEATTPATSSTVKVASAQVLAAIAKSDGAKDLMFEDEPDKSSAIPATYATMKPNVLNASSKPIVLTMKLKHQ